MPKLQFSHQQPPIFYRRNRLKKALRLFFSAIFNLTVLTILIGGGYYLSTTGAFEDIRNKYQIKNQDRPLTQAETKEKKLEIKNLITSVIVPSTDQAKEKRLELWRQLAKGLTLEKIILITREGGKDLSRELEDLFYGLKIESMTVKTEETKTSLDSLAASLSSTCQKKCLYVAVSNFSQEQLPAIADLHNQSSFRALADADFLKILDKTEVESKQALYLTAKIASLEKATYFHLEKNTTDQNYQRDEKTTSEPIIYFTKDKTKLSKLTKSTTFIFAGDVMLDRLINNRFKEDKLFTLFSNLDENLFRGFDSAVLNLEGPISDQPIEDDISPTNLSFNFPPKSAEVLKSLNIDAVSLANNHTLNAGAKGFETTKKMLEASKIEYLGHQKEFGEFSIFRSAAGDLPISVIGINMLEGSHQLSLKEKITQEKKQKRFVILFPHWGNEYENTHSQKQEQLANNWTNWGVDLIIGSHPHVTQDTGRINNKPVIYSLGNFVFDQTFSQETQRGLIIAGKLTETELTLVPLPVQIVSLKPRLITGDAKTKIIEEFVSGLSLTNDDRYDAQKGIIVIKRPDNPIL